MYQKKDKSTNLLRKICEKGDAADFWGDKGKHPKIKKGDVPGGTPPFLF